MKKLILSLAATACVLSLQADDAKAKAPKAAEVKPDKAAASCCAASCCSGKAILSPKGAEQARK